MEDTTTSLGGTHPNLRVPGRAQHSREEVLRTLKYWEHVERYSAPIAEDDGERSGDVAVSHIVDDKDPWPSTADTSRLYRHFVRFGIAPLRECDRLLIRRWSPEQGAHGRDPDEDGQYTFAGTFAVSDKRAVEKGSLVVNRFLYDLAVTLECTTITFSDYAEILATEFKTRAKPRSKPLAIAEALTHCAYSALQLPADIKATVKCIVVTRSKAFIDGNRPRKIQDARVFPSVYPNLLRQMASDLENGVVMGAAWDLLTKPVAMSDFDASSDETILECLQTDKYPSARWPSDFSLSPQQQVAVNETFSRVAEGGTFSINGPPGTGKTTLLMDVIAEVITRRADVLHSYEDPQSAFAPVAANGNSPQYRIDKPLHDFLVVIASTNNNAVANLTLELPRQEKLGESYRTSLSYLPKLAESLMAQHHVAAEAWGAISVPLGNRRNRDLCAASVIDALDDGTLFDSCNATAWNVARDRYAAAKQAVGALKATHRWLNQLMHATETFGSKYTEVGPWSGPARASVASPLSSGALAIQESATATILPHPILARAGEQIECALEELGGVVTAAEYINAEPRCKAQMLVGTSSALERARAELFVAAMKLHESFVFHARNSIQANLIGWVKLNSGKASTELEALAGHLWSTFSLLVPVVSSTFCSFANVFGSFERGTIPWLIVDEAGQACSHHAIDAVSRAKRAIIVGDPFQLEPISTISNSVDRALAAKFDVGSEFRCKSSSLQTLADRINPFGAVRNGRWIGAPLRVHRRCVEPMFSISNGMAYEHSMVLADETVNHEARQNERRPTFGPSAWINVVGTAETANDFYIPEEGAVAAHVISRHIANRHSDRELPDLFVITPFRKVAVGLKLHLLQNATELFGDLPPAIVEEWIDHSIGTVHSFQGREAETVLLVLGAKRVDSIEWALSQPNIMNVAVTRARRRLYVVGNRANWFQKESRDRWMLGTDRDWLIEECEARTMFDSRPQRKPRLRLV
ncbi:ATP-binding protein [Rhizobium sp. 3T7]|uniref:DEAD/DEAH box helicase n=1 Tax=Rhizobium sp. 3T7 TaxID=2874922 RepID=UPI001CC9CE37|nr:ATP-binding protein [Rhizobium sp. 3T7]MBZ9791732.1 ATP-binding protein [Rhizobium sp. 3T7]